VSDLDAGGVNPGVVWMPTPTSLYYEDRDIAGVMYRTQNAMYSVATALCVYDC
jgi:hypothetical protein